jgi:hypothetical protein
LYTFTAFPLFCGGISSLFLVHTCWVSYTSLIWNSCNLTKFCQTIGIRNITIKRGHNLRNRNRGNTKSTRVLSKTSAIKYWWTEHYTRISYSKCSSVMLRRLKLADCSCYYLSSSGTTPCVTTTSSNNEKTYILLFQINY